MRHDRFTVAVVLTLLVACESDRRRSAAATSENQEPATLPPSTPSPNDADSLSAPSHQPATAVVAAVRRYPSFPNAVTEVPPWNDAEPPFDLAEFLKVPPAEENAALLYLDAFREFDGVVDAWLAQYDTGFQKLAAAQQHQQCSARPTARPRPFL